MYCEELQRSPAPSESCDPPRSALTKLVVVDSMKKYKTIMRLVAWRAVNCRFQG